MTVDVEQTVRGTVQDGIAILTIDYPPVNTLGWAVRDGLIHEIGRAAEDRAVEAIVLIGANDRFVGGADILELHGERKDGVEGRGGERGVEYGGREQLK